MTHAYLKRLRTECRDFLELVAIPGLAALLPWPICFRVFKLIARCPWLYEPVVNKAVGEAMAFGIVEDKSHWRRGRRLTTLVDHADLYLSITRSDRWMKKYLDVSGAWPTPGTASLLCTFHWGAGMWALRHAASIGLKPHALVASLDKQYFVGREVLYRYAKRRTAHVASVLGQPTIDVAKNLRAVVNATRLGEPLLAAVDAPADQADASQTVSLMGRSARVPTALIKLANQRNLHISVFTTGIDLNSGKRHLSIHALEPERSVEKQVEQVFAHLDEAMTANPVEWHFWTEVKRIFVMDPPSHNVAQVL